MKVRIKFTKTGPMQYVGHLDLLRYFQKAFRRAGVDIAYSSGYRPHQIVSFASPLGIGLTSEGEYMDAQFVTVDDSQTMIDRLNAVMAEGIRITQFLVLDEKERNAMASVAGADYRVTVRQGYYESVDFSDFCGEFLRQDAIFVTKKTKKGEKDEDIRPYIYEMRGTAEGLYLLLCAGSSHNLKPETVMKSFCAFLHMPYETFGFRIHRLDTYLQDDPDDITTLRPLGAVGHEAKTDHYETKE